MFQHHTCAHEVHNSLEQQAMDRSSQLSLQSGHTFLLRLLRSVTSRSQSDKSGAGWGGSARRGCW